MQFIDLKAQQNQKLKGGITLKEDIEKNINKQQDTSSMHLPLLVLS